MKFLYYLFVIITVAQALVVRHTKEVDQIPAPEIKSMHFHTHRVKLGWSSVENPDSSDPVLGYKVKVWQSVDCLDPMDMTTLICKNKPDEVITLLRPGTTANITQEHVKLGQFQVAVQAFTEKREGPLGRIHTICLY